MTKSNLKKVEKVQYFDPIDLEESIREYPKDVLSKQGRIFTDMGSLIGEIELLRKSVDLLDEVTSCIRVSNTNESSTEKEEEIDRCDLSKAAKIAKDEIRRIREKVEHVITTCQL